MQFRFPITWLAETNSPLPAEKLLKYQAMIWSNSERWWVQVMRLPVSAFSVRECVSAHVSPPILVEGL